MYILSLPPITEFCGNNIPWERRRKDTAENFKAFRLPRRMELRGTNGVHLGTWDICVLRIPAMVPGSVCKHICPEWKVDFHK